MHYRHIQLVLLTLMLLVCVALLSACGHVTPQVNTVYNTKYIHTEMPSEVTTKVIPTPPIDVDAYLAMSTVQREVYMSNYVLDLLGSIATCNNKLATVEKVIETQKGVHSESKPNVQGDS